MNQEKIFDALVIGAGAAGLMAAWELVQTGKSVAVLEAKEKAGGRIHTIQDNRFDLPVELGAEFVHGKLKLTQLLMEKASLSKYESEGDIWRKEDGRLTNSDFIEDYADLNKKFRELKNDLPVKEFFEKYLADEKYDELKTSLRSYVEGYYAADTSRASTFALRDELQNSDEEQYRIEGGYEKLIDFLLDQLQQNKINIHYSTPALEVNWQKNNVVVVAGRQSFRARKLLVTVSVGVLQNDAIKFSPLLPQLREAVHKLGYGPVIKILFQFKTAFWKEKRYTEGKDLSGLAFVFSEEPVPTWWTYHPKDVSMITGWIGGPNAVQLKDHSEEELVHIGLTSLSKIFTIDEESLKEMLKAARIFDWMKDPFTCGGYSYETTESKEARKIITRPVDHTLFFAGEGLYDGTEIGTVEAALINGRDTAHKMIASF